MERHPAEEPAPAALVATPQSGRAGKDSFLRPGCRSYAADVKEAVPVTVTVKSRNPAHRCFGQARALFDDYRSHYGQLPSPGATHAITNARVSGALRVSLQTEPDNTAAMALYTAG